MFQFCLDEEEDIQKCKVWVYSISEVIEAKDVSEFSDKILGWMSACARLLAMAETEILQAEGNEFKRMAQVVGNNINAMVELKYRVFDMLCHTDAQYQDLYSRHVKLQELKSTIEKLWSVLEISARMTYRLLDLKRQEGWTPSATKMPT